MIKRCLLLLIFFPGTYFCVADDEIPSTGNERVDDLINYLSNEFYTMHYIASERLAIINTTYQQAVLTVNQWKQTALNGNDNPTTQAYNTGRADGGQQLLTSYLDRVYSQAYNECDEVMDDVASCQRTLVTLANALANDPNGLTDVLKAISNNTRVVSYAVNTNMAVCISNVQEIVSLLKLVFPSSDDGSNSDSSSAVESLDGNVRELVIDFALFWETADSLISWMNDIDEDFRKFYQIARSRMTAPDYKLSTALRDMWDDACLHRAEIVYGAFTNLTSYTVQDQTEIVLQQVSQDLRLSNEGQIALENLAVNTRTYFALVELCNKQQTNSIADLSFFTNYLSQIQAPFFNQYKQLISLNLVSSPFYPTRYSAFTNFVGVALNDGRRQPLMTAYSQYTREQTNVIARLETLLLYQNGLLGPPLDIYGGEETEYEFSNHLDRENVERNFNYATNSVSEFVQNVSLVTNNLFTLFTSIKSCLDAFDLSQGGEGDGVFRLSPSYELGGVQMGGFYLNWSDFSDITDTCRIIFQVIWYFLFGFISYKFTVLTFIAFTKSLKFFVGIFSRLMS